MNVQNLEIDKSKINIDPGVILTYLGNGEGVVETHTEELIDQYTTECKKIMSPRGGYARFDAVVSESNKVIEIEGTRFQTGRIINKMLNNAEEYIFFMVTAGPAPESLSRTLLEEGQYLEGYLVDLIGSGIVESAVNQLHDHIRNMAASRGFKATNWYSPGYCSWNVSEQQKLFSLIPKGCCGITLSDSSLMSPIKSLSGIVGIGTSVKFQEYTCEICNMKDCMFRKVKN